MKEGDEVELRSGAHETFEVAKPLTVEAAIADLRRFHRRLPPPGFKFARALAARYGFSWSDAVIVASTLEGNCSRLIPADVHDGQRIGDLTIVSPFR